MNINEFMSCQSGFIKLERYESEFATMRLVYDLPAQQRLCIDQLALRFLTSMENETRLEFAEQITEKISNRLRLEGNIIFKSKEEPDLPAAIRVYTKAIFAAPPGTQALALAHANRGMALQEFGYFQQAYDDCVNALAVGYPQHLRHKILIRQAFCAWKLTDTAALQLHLDALDKLCLNDNFTNDVKNLHIQLETQRKHQTTNDVPAQANLQYESCTRM